MSQASVEKVIGRLVTDEGFRRRFTTSPHATLQSLAAIGLELNECERRALVAIDPQRVELFAEALHPCIQKVEIPGEIQGECS